MPASDTPIPDNIQKQLLDYTNILVISEDALPVCVGSLPIEMASSFHGIIISLDTELTQSTITGIDWRSLRFLTTEPETPKIESGDNIEISEIDDPLDLTQLGIEITNVLQEVETNDEILLCFRSISVLLEEFQEDQVYRFIHTLTRQIDLTEKNVRAYYSIDPELHAEETIRTFISLFEGVLDMDEAGSWRFRSH